MQLTIETFVICVIVAKCHHEYQPNIRSEVSLNCLNELMKTAVLQLWLIASYYISQVCRQGIQTVLCFVMCLIIFKGPQTQHGVQAISDHWWSLVEWMNEWMKLKGLEVASIKNNWKFPNYRIDGQLRWVIWQLKRWSTHNSDQAEDVSWVSHACALECNCSTYVARILRGHFF